MLFILLLLISTNHLLFSAASSYPTDRSFDNMPAYTPPRSSYEFMDGDIPNVDRMIDRWIDDNTPPATDRQIAEEQELAKLLEYSLSQSPMPAKPPLIDACQHNNICIVLRLLKDGEDPFVQDNGLTPFMIAASSGHKEIIYFFLAVADKKRLLTERSSEGYTARDLALLRGHTEVAKILLDEQNGLTEETLCQSHFAPNILGAILSFITKEQEEIVGAMYRFTHGHPARALVDRKRHGVKTEIILHREINVDLCIALRHMLQNGIGLFKTEKASNGDASEEYFNQHHKFLLFKNNLHNRPVLITGSCNFTYQAFCKNWENIIITDNPQAIESFGGEYAKLRAASRPLTHEECVSEKDTSPKGFYSRRENQVEGLLTC